MLSQQIQKFMKLEAAGGIILFGVLIVALVIANSPFNHIYQQIIDLPIQIRIGQLDLSKSLLLWVNEALMAIFFMLLSLEIKREIIDGELSEFNRLTLPIVAAIGGIAIPALVYALFNYHDKALLAGWPIATTTDIAFVLGVISLLGRRVPNSLKVFVVALSIVDDILAIAIIALVYTSNLSYSALLGAAAGAVLLFLFNIFNVKRIAPYILVGIVIWICVLKSNIHATLAGVLIGFAIPLNVKGETDYSPLRHLEHILHPWVAFFILPLFVFVNGGVPFVGTSLSQLFSSVPIGIAAGLFIGKTFGIFLLVWLLIISGLGKKPTNSNWPQIIAVSSLTGIGFTMSLFLSALAFSGSEFENLARQGVLLGSAISCIFGVGLLLLTGNKNTNEDTED